MLYKYIGTLIITDPIMVAIKEYSIDSNPIQNKNPNNIAMGILNVQNIFQYS